MINSRPKEVIFLYFWCHLRHMKHSDYPVFFSVNVALILGILGKIDATAAVNSPS